MVICGTGHRPEKLGGYSDETTERLIVLASQHLGGVTKVVSGMAQGWDTALAIAAIQKGIPVVAAVPFKGQEKIWPKDAQNIYNNILDLCEEVVIITEGEYAVWKLQARNIWMVDHSDSVLALWDGTGGGTANCIKYATKVNRPVVNIWKSYQELQNAI